MIGETLGKSGVPGWALEPRMTMYSLDRMIKMGKLARESWAPACGIMAGCVIAMVAKAVCARLWSEEPSPIEHLTGRLYVDDTTAWSTGTGDQIDLGGTCHGNEQWAGQQ